LSGSKQLLILVFAAFTIQSCSVFEGIFGSKRTPPPPPPPIEEVDPIDPEGQTPTNTDPEIEPEPRDTIIIPDPPVVKKEEANIAIMLPFQLDAMDASNSFPSAARNSLHLYKGIQYALAEANFSDKNVNVYVIDNAGDDATTQSLLQKHPFPDVDVVIGPLYTKSLKLVGDYAKQNKITFISPLSSADDLGTDNDYLLSANATISTRYEAMFTYIKDEFINPNVGLIYQPVRAEETARRDILKAAAASKVELKEQQSDGRDMFSSVTNLLQKGRENIIITGVDDNEEGTLYLDRLLMFLNQMGEGYDIQVFGLREWNDVKAIAPMKYPNVDLYILDRFLDPTNSPRAAAFNQLQYKNQNRPLHIYSLQGYDLMSYLLALIDEHGEDFETHITKSEYQGLQTKYQFGKWKSDAGFQFYDNKNIHILRYKNGSWQHMN